MSTPRLRARRQTASPASRLRSSVLSWGSVIALVVSALTVAGTAQAHHDPCGADGVTDYFVWDGKSGDATLATTGDGIHWEDPYNWDKDCVPGVFERGLHGVPAEGTGPYDDHVTIPATVHDPAQGVDVAVNAVLDKDYVGGYGWQYVRTLVNHGTVTVRQGTKLFVSNASVSKNLVLREGTLGGQGSFRVTGSLLWRSSAAGSSTQTTRDCTTFSGNAALTDCTTRPAVLGRTIIDPGASMTIDGLGVNLKDQRVIENHGTVVLRNGGYIAADHGTAFRNLRDAGTTTTGRFIIQNDRGYYEGRRAQDLAADPYFGAAWADVKISAFTNTGSVLKTAGSGVSIIAAGYASTTSSSTYTGRVEVRSTGTVSVVTPSGTTQTRTGFVRGGGARFGNGGPAPACDATVSASSCLTVTPTAGDPQVTTVEVTKALASATTVTIQELQPVAGFRGVPVKIEVPAAATVATASEPLRFRILLDSTKRKAGETAAQAAQLAQVFREETSLTTPLPDCDSATQNPTPAVPTCVARTYSVNETNGLANGDVVLVISTLQNSRYRVGA